MITGQSARPYPFVCPQRCWPGAKYSHGKANESAPIYYPTYSPDLGSSVGCAEDATGAYPPCPIHTSGSTAPTGVAWPGFYQVNGSAEGGAVPSIVWKNAKTVTAVTVTGGGTAYKVGDLLTSSNGVAIPYADFPLELKVTAISGGGATGPIVSVEVVTGGQFRQGFLATTFGAGSLSGATGATFSLTWGNAYQDFSVCQKRGFKSLAGAGNWMGQLDLLNGPQSVEYGMGNVPASAACFATGSLVNPNTGYYGFVIGGYNGTVPGTKYLTLAVSVTTENYDITTGASLGVGTYTSNFTVNKYSGEQTGSGSSAYTGSGSDPALTTPLIVGNVLDFFTGPTFNGLLSVFAQNPSGFSGEVSGSVSGSTYTVSDAGPTYGMVVATRAIGISGGGLTLDYASYDPYGSGNASAIYAHYSATLTATEVTLTYDSYEVDGGTGAQAHYLHISGTYQLSNPWTSASFLADVFAQMNAWNLADDMQYPWRQDGYPNIAPLTVRNQTGSTPPLVNFDTSALTPNYAVSGAPNTEPWFDVNCNVWLPTTAYPATLCKVIDGSTLGAPNPAGYRGGWVWGFRNYGDSYEESGIVSYGTDAFSFDNVQMPPNATNFTDGFFAALTPPSSTVNFMNPDTDVFSSNEYDLQILAVVQCLEEWSSEDYGRPGGWDKFAVDETKVICSTGGTFASEIPTTGLYVYVTGSGAAPSGVYSLASGAPAISSGTLVYNLPATWWSDYYTKVAFADAGDFVGWLRYQSGGASAAPSLLGRVGLALTSGTGPYTYTMSPSQPCFGMAVAGTEQVDVYDKTMSVIASNVTATRVSDATFTLVASQPAAAWVMIHGAPAWYFHTNYPRGRFGTATWTYDLRTRGEITRQTGSFECDGTTPVYTGSNPSPLGGVGYVAAFTQTQHCLPNFNCGPRVCGWIPPGSAAVFSNGVVGTLPTISLDTLYGSQWSGQLLDTMESYFWQSPHTPCNGTKVQDDGSCNSSANYEYAETVECDITAPLYGYAGTTAPNLPPGVTSLALIDPTAYTTGAALPPGPGSPAGSWLVRSALITGNEGCYNYPNWVIVP